MKIQEFITEVRLFEILYDGMNFYNENLKEILLNYIDKYIKYKNIKAFDLQISYESFIKQYSKDCKYYIKNNTYPAIDNGVMYNISREEYDIFLLLSTILTMHRFDISYNILKNISITDKALVIGSGIGIELELMKNKYLSIDAYDLEIDNFSKQAHPEVIFYEELFHSGNDKYNDIFVIELLEHIQNPFHLLDECKKSLVNNGRILITLAVNIPQFDHVYNFDNIDKFYKEVENIGLKVESSIDIKHKYLRNGLENSSNIFMILKEI
jgi:2-polyprenyl-3-methyl-5-hydroxy-6-metoxy-1,4-benzoquinol methylase